MSRAHPYADVPDYADTDYVDGKLKVAAGIIRRADNPDLRARWLATTDELLEHRLRLAAQETTP